MPGIRTLEHGYDESQKTYATPDRAEKEAKKWADKLHGICNVRIVPSGYGTLSPNSYPLRYTAIFSCFSEESDIFLLARAACPFLIHR